MATPNTPTVVLQNAFLPVVLQSFLAEICSKALLTLVQSACVLKGSCGIGTITCTTNYLHHGESRRTDAIQPCSTGSSISSDIDEENTSEKCTVSILNQIPAPEVAGRVSQHHFSEWLLVAKNKDDEDEDEDEDEDDDDDEEGDEDDDDGDDEEGDDDEEGAEGEGAEGEGDEDDEDDEADDDEDEEDEDDDEDEDEDESPPKKLKK